MEKLFQQHFDVWSLSSPGFSQFLATNEKKIAKKIRDAQSDGARRDLLFELHIPFLLLKDPATSIQYEPWKKLTGPSPDFLIETHGKPWSVEVKRLRDRGIEIDLDAEDIEIPVVASSIPKLRQIILDALPQCKPDLATVVWINTDCGATNIEDLSIVLGQLSEESELPALSGAAILSTWPSMYSGRRFLARVNQNAACILHEEAISVLLQSENFDTVFLPQFNQSADRLQPQPKVSPSI